MASNQTTSVDDREPIEIAPTSRAEAIALTERIHRRTGRPVVIKEGHPGLEEPEAATASIPLTGNTAEDTQRALESNEQAGGEKAPARKPEETE